MEEFFRVFATLILLKETRLPVTRWVNNTINDQFDRNAILTTYIYIYTYIYTYKYIYKYICVYIYIYIYIYI